MSNAYDAAGQSGEEPPAPGGPGGGGGPPMGRGGGVLAALQRQQQGPQPSAPGPGNQADSMIKIQTAVGMIEQALGGIEKTSPFYRDAVNALSRLSRHMAQGPPTAGVQMTQMGDLFRGFMKNALLQRIMGQQGGQGGEVTGAPQPPQPSTPLPGA